MPFSEIVGQENAVSILRGAIRRGHLSHAYLFLGIQGVGKLRTTVGLAKALNCSGNDDDYCDACISCRKIDHRTHPDIHILEAGSAARIKIDQVRGLIRALALAPYEGAFKFGIVDGADKMTVEAANCLLKTLEEPPPNTVLVLLCEGDSTLLPTIISRCQKVRFRPLAEEYLAQHARRELGLDEAQSRIMAAFAEGSLGKINAERVALITDKRGTFVRELERVRTGGVGGVFSFAQKLLSEEDALQEILELIRIWIRDLMIVKTGSGESRLRNQDLKDLLHERAETWKQGDIARCLWAIQEAERAIRHNVNKRLSIEIMTLRMLDRSSYGISSNEPLRA